ncbi:ExeA family protein [Pelomicrobium sp.]|jgi:MSHA biogenesis protein MshM|uniref:ExeA family protein n=1 Tax=Pelomicrobium sp. TaxID=2815319 RepID=UPI002FDDFD95
MYEAHFGLRELPFGLTPDTSFFFACSTYQEALNTLLVAAGTGEGFIKITGEVGTGKTLLARKFLSSLGRQFVTAYIPNPYLDSQTLLQTLAEDFQVQVPGEGDCTRLIRALTHALLDYARAGKRVLVCLDEAQAMPLKSLETLRLLTNLETEKRKLVQVVLFGQPELDENLQDRSVRQLRQRITFQYRLRGLSSEETRRYLNHRLRVAGHRGEEVFTAAAVRLLHAFSGGVPRLLNILAHKSMMLAYGKGRRTVAAGAVVRAALDTPAAARGFARRAWPVATGALLSLGGLTWMWLA